MGFDRWRQARDESKTLDLIPIMNLMVTLIPFLMLGAAFYHVGVIPTTLPAKVDEAAAPPSDVKITAQLELDADGTIRLSASAAQLDATQLGALAASFSPKQGRADLAGLVAQLSAIKRRYPKSDTVLVLAADDLPYQQLVEALDAARDTPGAKPDARVPLFPVAVFSKKLVPAVDAGVPEGEGAP